MHGGSWEAQGILNEQTWLCRSPGLLMLCLHCEYSTLHSRDYHNCRDTDDYLTV
jgi:hypothetical protein